jgi:hypothetical protein
MIQMGDKGINLLIFKILLATNRWAGVIGKKKYIKGHCRRPTFPQIKLI